MQKMKDKGQGFYEKKFRNGSDQADCRTGGDVSQHGVHCAERPGRRDAHCEGNPETHPGGGKGAGGILRKAEDRNAEN